MFQVQYVQGTVYCTYKYDSSMFNISKYVKYMGKLIKCVFYGCHGCDRIDPWSCYEYCRVLDSD